MSWNENIFSTQDTVALWGMSSDHFAQYLLSQRKNRAALERFKAAHETCRKLVGDSHPQTLVLLNSIGELTSISTILELDIRSLR